MNLQQTVTNEKCKNLYTNKVIRRWKNNNFADKKDDKAINSIKRIPYAQVKNSS